MTLRLVALVSLALVVLSGCADVECDPGQINTGEYCMTAPPPPAADMTAGGAGGAPNDEEASGFGMTCSDPSECPEPTDWCAVEPPAASGFCTRKGCLEDPSVCPDAWSCMDRSVFSPTLPSICTPP